VGYIASALMAGTFLAIGAFLSAFTKNQVIAFVLSGVACFLLMVIGFPMLLDFVSGWLPRTAVEAIAAMSVLTHFESMMRGVLDGRDVLYFVSVSAAFLFLNGIVVEWKKAE
jgi:ABC-2 type transport system permease protein